VSKNVFLIIEELTQVFSNTDFSNQEELLDEISSARKIVCAGAGRVGLAVAGFSKRLRHLGKDAFWIDDMTLPRMSGGDLMIIGSGSGETETILGLARIGKRQGLRIAIVTSARESTLRQLADVAVVLNCPNKFAENAGVRSNQPMTTLFEQACQVYLDGVVLDLMNELGVSDSDMKERHNVIE
jgi:6-phospho-3-hexuloisomerase